MFRRDTTASRRCSELRLSLRHPDILSNSLGSKNEIHHVGETHGSTDRWVEVHHDEGDKGEFEDAEDGLTNEEGVGCGGGEDDGSEGKGGESESDDQGCQVAKAGEAPEACMGLLGGGPFTLRPPCLLA